MTRMREILVQIQNGKSNFGSRDITPEAINEFQATAEHIMEAQKSGYLAGVNYRRDASNGDILSLEIIDGLTFEGVQFLLKH